MIQYKCGSQGTGDAAGSQEKHRVAQIMGLACQFPSQLTPQHPSNQLGCDPFGIDHGFIRGGVECRYCLWTPRRRVGPGGLVQVRWYASLAIVEHGPQITPCAATGISAPTHEASCDIVGDSRTLSVWLLPDTELRRVVKALGREDTLVGR